MQSINTAIRPLPPTGYAEKKEVAPKLALIDDFDGDPDGFPHGQAVESVLLSHSALKDEDVQRYQNEAKQADLRVLMNEDKLDFNTAYRTMITRNVAHFYLSTATNLNQIVTEQPTIKVISQSQGETPGRQLEGLFNGLRENEAFRQGAAVSMGLAPDAPLSDICQSLLNAADQAVAQNEFCQKARDHYEEVTKRLYDQGITYLVAAGNHGSFGDTLASIGVEQSPSSFRNVLVNDYVTVVGATTPEGEPARLNSPGAAIEVYRRGEDLPWSAEEGFDQSGVASGTSFATPIAAADALAFIADNPQAGPFEVEGHLKGVDAYRVEAGGVLQTSNGQELAADGKLESYIENKLGPGFITDITSEDATQIAQAKQDTALFGLPGEQEHEFQLISMRTDNDGQRSLKLETYFDEGHHVIRALESDGAWDPATVIEELHLDPKRAQAIANQD